MTLEIILALLFLVLAIKGIADPFWGMVGLLCVTMINPGELYPLFAALRMEKIFALLVLLSWFVHEKIVVPPISKKLLVFWGSLIIGIPFAYWKGGAFSGVLAFFPTLLYHLVMINLVNTKERFLTILAVYVSLVGWIASGAVWGYMHGQVYEGAAIHGMDRAQGLTSSAGDPNSLGVLLVVGMPLIALLMLQGTKKQKVLGAVVLILSVFTVMITGSRGSLASMILLLAAFIFTRKKGLLLVPVAVILLAASWAVVPQNVKERYLEIGDVVKNENLDESFLMRKYSRIAGWHMFLDYPFFGVGAGVFKFANGAEYWPGPGRKVWLQSHNTYVQLIADTGLVGTITWLIFFGSLVHITLRLRRYFRSREDIHGVFRFYPSACLFSITIMLVNGYSTHQIYSGAWYFLAALSGTLYYQLFPAAQDETDKRAFAHEPVVEVSGAGA